MKKYFRFLLLAALVIAPAFAQGARKIGEVRIDVDGTLPVRVTANTAELQTLALIAFGAHGRYDVSGRRASAYDIKFTSVAPTQVRVDITKGAAATPVASQIASGNSPRNALLRAADIAVEKTNGLGLRGFFTARLAFISKRTGKSEVYVSDLFLGEGKQLTHEGAHVLSPRWAPDGSRILVTSYFKTGAPDIFLIDPNSARKDMFISYRGSNLGARFSPNGQQVAMVLTGEGTPEIYISNAQGRQVTRKTRSDAVKSSPCWSPDGSQIVFAMGESSPQLHVMSAAGGTPRRLSSGFTYVAEPDWSRTERNKIACTVRVAGSKYQIAVVDASSGQTKVVSKASFDGVEPSWLADGRHLVYTARDRTTSMLAILDTETGISTPLGQAASAAMQASVWTP